MKYSPSRIAKALHRRLVLDPKGHGRPVDKAALDNEYRTGNWAHFFAWDELPRHLVLAGAVHHFYPKPAVLDLGCGSGRLAQLFQSYPFSRYLGVDLSTEGVAQARALDLAGVEFMEGSFETWRPAEKFDAITFNECIGYAADPGATLEAFFPSLNSGGRIFVSHHRFGKNEAQWRRMEEVAEVEASTAVMSAKGNIWDIKVLRPRAVGR
jgi:trans-aconitate methyltransferase